MYKNKNIYNKTKKKFKKYIKPSLKEDTKKVVKNTFKSHNFTKTKKKFNYKNYKKQKFGLKTNYKINNSIKFNKISNLLFLAFKKKRFLNKFYNLLKNKKFFFNKKRNIFFLNKFIFNLIVVNKNCKAYLKKKHNKKKFSQIKKKKLIYFFKLKLRLKLQYLNVKKFKPIKILNIRLKKKFRHLKWRFHTQGDYLKTLNLHNLLKKNSNNHLISSVIFKKFVLKQNKSLLNLHLLKFNTKLYRKYMKLFKLFIKVFKNKSIFSLVNKSFLNKQNYSQYKLLNLFKFFNNYTKRVFLYFSFKNKKIFSTKLKKELKKVYNFYKFYSWNNLYLNKKKQFKLSTLSFNKGFNGQIDRGKLNYLSTISLKRGLVYNPISLKDNQVQIKKQRLVNNLNLFSENKRWFNKKFNSNLNYYKLLNFKLLFIGFQVNWNKVYSDYFNFFQIDFLEYDRYKMFMYKNNSQFLYNQYGLNKFQVKYNRNGVLFLMYIAKLMIDLKLVRKYLKTSLILINYNFYQFTHYILFCYYKIYENQLWNLELIKHILF